TACPYTIDYKSDSNAKFKAEMAKEFQTVAGFYAAGMYVSGMVIEAGLKALHGDVSNPEQTIKALRAVNLQDTPRGPVHFDHFGNVVGNIFVRKIEKVGGKLTNVTQKTYTKKKYLAQPAYTRAWPPVKACKA